MPLFVLFSPFLGFATRCGSSSLRSYAESSAVSMMASRKNHRNYDKLVEYYTFKIERRLRRNAVFKAMDAYDTCVRYYALYVQFCWACQIFEVVSQMVPGSDHGQL